MVSIVAREEPAGRRRSVDEIEALCWLHALLGPAWPARLYTNGRAVSMVDGVPARYFHIYYGPHGELADPPLDETGSWPTPVPIPTALHA